MKGHGVVLALVLAAQPALAGTEITVETRRAGAAPARSRSAAWSRSRGGSSAPRPATADTARCCSGAEGVLEILDHSEKSVVRIDRATARSMARRMDGARDALEALPEPQRSTAERCSGASRKPAQVALRATGKSDR